MKRPVILVAALVVIFVVCIAVFMVYREKPGGTNTIVVGVLSWPGDGPIYIGDEKGFFRDEGIDLQIQLIESYDSRRAALIAGQIHIDCNTLDQLLIYAENNVDAQVFGLSDFSTGGDGIIAKKEIKSLEDLRGKTVAYAEASPSEFFLRYLLKQKGIPFADLKRKPVADAQAAGTAVLAGQVDAAVTYEPWLTKSKENPRLHLLASTREFPELIPGLFIARGADLVARKNLYRGFMRAWFRSVEYFEQHPESSKTIMARRMGVSRQELDSILTTIRILGKQENDYAFDKDSSQSIFKLTGVIAIFWKESGFISKTYDADKLIFDILDGHD